MNTTMKVILAVSIVFFLYIVFKQRIEDNIFKPRATQKKGKKLSSDDIPVVSELKNDIDSELYVEIELDDPVSHDNNARLLGYDDLIKLSSKEEFHRLFVHSLKVSLDYKEQYYTKILLETEPVKDVNHNDIASRLSCNNDIIRNVEEILQCIHTLRAKIDTPQFNIKKRLDTSMQLLNKIVGRDDIKDIVAHDIIVFSKSPRVYCNSFNNMVIYGPPGCGKSYCVEMVDMVYYLLGITLRPTKKITKEDLANGYVNESSRQTRKTLLDGLERVVFIDEAYILSADQGKNPFASSTNTNEVITTIVQFLAEYEGKINLIVAGYEEDMGEFLKTNSGNGRRFPDSRRVEFKQYSAKDLTSIFISRVSESDNDIQFSGKSISHLYTLISNYYDSFNNGAGDMANLSRSFIEFCYLSSNGNWVSGDYRNNAKILTSFFTVTYKQR